MKTFKVDAVKHGKFEKNKYSNNEENLLNLLGPGIEAKSFDDSSNNFFTFADNNFISAINTAYDQHLPLVLSPDAIWLIIAQGVAKHIELNAEELRYQFVNFDGQKTIKVYENTFIKGSTTNNWQNTFHQFSNGIKEYIGKKKDLIVGEFSTTTPVSLAANEIVLMEAMKKYFKYECHTCCGIPEITILGTVSDWLNIKNRLNTLAEFNLSWWTDKVIPVIDEFIAVFHNKINTAFWQEIYKRSGGSGGPYISGWITNLFPYLRNNKRNNFEKRDFGGLTSYNLPIGLSKVPFEWFYYDQKFNMELMAGFMSFEVKDNLVIPRIDWAIKDNDMYVEFECILEFDKNVRDWKKLEVIYERCKQDLEKIGVTLHDKYLNPVITGRCVKEKINDVLALSDNEISVNIVK